MKTLVLSYNDVKSIIDMDFVIPAVEFAFKSHGKGEAIMPAKVYLTLPKYHGDFRAMPAYLKGRAGVKWVNSHPKNPIINKLPSVLAVLIYSDPKTAVPLAIMDGTLITNYRTGAAGAIAAKYLAKKNVKTLGLIGCGVQAHTQLLAISKLFKLKEIYLFDVSKENINKFRKLHKKYSLKESSLQEAASADIVCTTTPSYKPIVKREWIKDGVHINAIGADAPGKQELEYKILKDAKILIDDYHQACHSGEVNVPLTKGQIKEKDIHGTLGEVVAGMKKGRTTEREITVFDSTGLAIQDIAVAKVIYEQALKRKLGTKINLVGL